MHIRTDRLLLRTLEQRDAADLLSMFKNDRIKQTYMIPDFPTEEAANKLVQRFIELSHDRARVVIGIERDGRMIGFINDTGIENGSIELGYVIHPDEHGKGYMTEALGAMIPLLFEQGFSEIVAGAFKENAASIRVMEKCGMMRMDKQETCEYRGKMHDCVYYAIQRI